MGLFRLFLLKGSESARLKAIVPRLGFVRKAVRRFLPGEDLEAAITVARDFQNHGIPTTFTKLGENIVDLQEANEVTQHYLAMLERISQVKLDVELSLKLTQLGFDLSPEQTHNNFRKIAAKAAQLATTVWIDMESSSYTESTIEFFENQRSEFENVGLCLQAYLFRTKQDLDRLLELSPAIRLVKGAYKEPGEIAFKKKKQVDQNFLNLSQRLLQEIKNKRLRVAFATHDINLLMRISGEAEGLGIPRNQLEFQMLYGIRPRDQLRLAWEGYTVRVLISYGSAWFAWYMRRLAERPANVWFVMKNMFPFSR